MKANTTKEFPYTGDHYSYNVVTSADGTVSNNVYVTTPQQVTMRLTVNLLGELVIVSQTKMQLNAYIGNIVDANGDEIYADGLWKVTQTAPLLGPAGLKDGYRYRAVLIEGQI